MDKKKLFDAIDKIDDSFIAESMQKGGAARNRSESHAGIWATIGIIAAAAILIVFTTYHIHHVKNTNMQQDPDNTQEGTHEEVAATVDSTEGESREPQTEEQKQPIVPPDDFEPVGYNIGNIKNAVMVPGSVHLFNGWTSFELAVHWNNYLTGEWKQLPYGLYTTNNSYSRIFVPVADIECYSKPDTGSDVKHLWKDKFYMAVASDTKEWIEMQSLEGNSVFVHYMIDYTDPDEPEEMLLNENGTYRMRDLFVYAGTDRDNCEKTIARYDVSLLPEYDSMMEKEVFKVIEYDSVGSFAKAMENDPVWTAYGTDERDRLMEMLRSDPGPVRVYIQKTYGEFYNLNCYDWVNDRLIIFNQNVWYDEDGTPKFTGISNPEKCPYITLWIGRNPERKDDNGEVLVGYSDYMYVADTINVPSLSDLRGTVTLNQLDSKDLQALLKVLDHYPTHYMVPGSKDVFYDWVKDNAHLEDGVYYRRYDKAVIPNENVRAYTERDESSDPVTLLAGMTYYAVASDSEHWIRLEDEDGNGGWIRYGVPLRDIRHLYLYYIPGYGSANRLFSEIFTIE